MPMFDVALVSHFCLVLHPQLVDVEFLLISLSSFHHLLNFLAVHYPLSDLLNFFEDFQILHGEPFLLCRCEPILSRSVARFFNRFLGAFRLINRRHRLDFCLLKFDLLVCYHRLWSHWLEAGAYLGNTWRIKI